MSPAEAGVPPRAELLRELRGMAAGAARSWRAEGLSRDAMLDRAADVILEAERIALAARGTPLLSGTMADAMVAFADGIDRVLAEEN